MSGPSPAIDVCVIPSAGDCAVGYRPLDLDRDMPTIHTWIGRDYARHWGMQDQTLVQARAAYAELVSRPDQDIRIGHLAGWDQPLCLLECYLPTHDVLADHYDALESDRGLHLLVAPHDARPTGMHGLAYHLLRAACEYLFLDPEAQRIVVEPDLRNEAMHILCRQVGFDLSHIVHLPDKTALMMMLTREALASRPAVPAPMREAAPLTSAQVRRHLMFGNMKRRLQTVF